MERCAYCGERVGDDALYVDDEVFCSEECMRDFGAGNSDESDDYDDDDEEEEVEEASGGDVDEEEESY